MQPKHYEVKDILSVTQVTDLIHLYNKMKPNPAHQDYNLFDVDKRHPTGIERRSIVSKYRSAWRSLDEAAGPEYKIHSHYFLEYTEESFTRLHEDALDYVHLTMVTILDDTNLKGGEALVMLPYEKRARPANKYVKRYKEEAPVGEKIIPEIVNLDQGQTLVYDRDLKHGVCKVREGRRLVLVSWYDKAN